MPQLRSQVQPLLWRGIGLVALLGSAIVAQSNAIAQQTPASDDVIVDTEPKPGSTTPSTSGTRFRCDQVNGQYTVMYRPESQPGQSYAWANPTALGGGWSSDRRCAEISRRLESYRPDGLLEMRTTVENGYNTVCVTTQNVPGCRIVLTVPPGQDPISTRDRVFENLTVADSGQQTQAVNTYADRGQSRLGNGGLGNSGLGELGRIIGLPQSGRTRRTPTAQSSRMQTDINLRPFLDRADGGTGEKLRSNGLRGNSLRGNSPLRPGQRLNPDRFR